jgi:hypothetical protein
VYAKKSLVKRYVVFREIKKIQIVNSISFCKNILFCISQKYFKKSKSDSDHVPLFVAADDMKCAKI